MSDLQLGSLLVEDHGTGPAVLALHGLGGSSTTFEPLMEGLQRYRVLRPDWPGAGRSGLRPGRADLASFADIAREVLDLAGEQQAIVLGHSLGALVAQTLAARYPERVARLVLFGPLLEPTPAARAALVERAAAARRHGMADIATGIAAASLAAAAAPACRAFVRESLLGQPAAGYARHCEALAKAAAADHGAIGCPATLVAGSEDSIAPPATVRELAGRIAGSTCHELPGVGHWMTIEAPQRCAELLAGALTGE